MRIGIDVHAVERDGSGNCTYMRGLLRALACVDEENEYVLYGINLDHPFYTVLRRLDRFDIHPLRPSSAPLRIPYTLAACSVRDQLDLLHVQYGGPPFLRGRLVSAIHDVAFRHIPTTFSRIERLWMPRLIRLTARRASMVLTLSEFSRQQILDWAALAPERVRVAHCGIGPQFVPVPAAAGREGILKRYGISPPFIFSVGRLNRRKNLGRVFEAFEGLQEPKLQLVVAGRADYGSAELGRLISGFSARDRIRFTGFIADQDLPAVMSAAELFVYPSIFEGFGLPPLEAAACGTPVIASNTTALPEVLGNAALLVDPNDTDAMTDAMRRLLAEDDLREEMRRRGLARAAQFTWDETARRTVEAYEAAVK